MFKSYYSLAKHNTFGIDVYARFFAEPATVEEAMEAVDMAHRMLLPIFVLGGGSNILFTKNFEGLILSPKLMGMEVVKKKTDKVYVASSAGEVWDDLVVWCVLNNWGGIENLSHIPGTVGAAPVQNIGAYGVEVKDSIEKVEGFYLDTMDPFSISRSDCAFGYRKSIFKTELQGNVLITKVFFVLSSHPKPNTDYGRIVQYIQNQNDRSIQSIRQAIITIRSQKLPDPQKMGNAGSFFKNPSVDESILQKVRERFPDIPFYPTETDGYVKLPAAYLIEKCGWKGVKVGRVGVHFEQPLVLVAYEGATGEEVMELSKKIQHSVYEKFNVKLDREVVAL